MEIYGKQVSISSFNTSIEMAAPLNGLIFDAVYGSWILSLLLFTLGDTQPVKFTFLTRDFTFAN